MHFFNFKSKNIFPLYNNIVFLTRKKHFYNDFNLSDSFTNRIFLIFFHLSFILVILKNNNYNKEHSQNIFDFFFKQIETNFRELGHGDVFVNKNMKDLVKLFYEILVHCQNWDKLTIKFKSDLMLKYFNPNSTHSIITSKLINYFDKFTNFSKDIPLISLTKGVFSFAYKE